MLAKSRCLQSHLLNPTYLQQLFIFISLIPTRENAAEDMRKVAFLLCMLFMVAFFTKQVESDADENCKCLDITFNDGSTGKLKWFD